MIVLNKTCSSINLLLKNSIFFKQEDIIYELYQKEGNDNIFGIGFEKIYEGSNNTFEAIGLKQKHKYTFKLKIKNSNNDSDGKIEVETLSAPPALLSNDSLDIANGRITDNIKILSEKEKAIIAHCSSIVFEKNYSVGINGTIEGIIIKILHSKLDNTDIYYLSFDLEKEYFNDFVKKLIEDSDNNTNLLCNFIFNKIPTYFIFNLLKKGAVIFTGKLFGGVIASSIAFSILYMGKKINKNYSNIFKNCGKNHIGVVTFGSPSFINNGFFG